MVDVHDKATRTFNMSRIRGKDSKPELLVRKYLFSHGFRYKLHDKNLPGKPDLVFPRYRTVIFVHGCFWHGHKDCRYFVVPKTRTDWWLEKFARNKTKDRESLSKLLANGWKVITVFECELKPQNREATFQTLLNELS